MKGNTRKIVATGIVAAIYAILTIAFGFMSYSNIQFRIAEILVLLAFINKDYIWGLTIGCFLANILGVYGVPDTIFGTIATFISVCLIYLTRKYMGKNLISLVVASLWPTIVNAIVIGWMLNKFAGLPLFLSMLQVGFGEFVVITIVGVPFFNSLKDKHKTMLENAFKK